MKAMLMRDYNKPDLVNVKQITKEEIEAATKIPKLLSDRKGVKQFLLIDDKGRYVLREKAKEETENYNLKNMEMDVFLEEGNVLVETPRGWMKNLTPIRVLNESQVKTIKRFNKIA